MTRKLLGHIIVVALLMAFVTYSPIFGQTSSSPEPGNKSMLQACDGYPNYGTQIDFEDVVAGTVINTQYQGLGVKFGAAAGGPVTIARTDGARPLDGNILAGQPIFTGDVHASFWLPAGKAFVTEVGASVGYLDVVGTITMNAYDCEGDLVGSYTNTISGGNGIEFFSIAADTIHKVIFFMGTDPAGSDIDCFTYNDLQPCPDTAIPTLTEWGIIIFCVLLFGWMAWVIVRRKRAARVGI
jgi:hypothetical protein